MGGMLTPVKGGSAKPCSDKDKDNNKRLARCGKCTNCKSQASARGIGPLHLCPKPEVTPAIALQPRAAHDPASLRSSGDLLRHADASQRALLAHLSALLPLLQDCGACYNCADKPKFGGPGAPPAARRICT